ncbi:hypothetical protein WA1_13840 [Scytonema hofmannii PCC 7110]|uniref:Uncharacterized protein n=1 Tax=Scytonema hofmannii PCC 7110 TaxID=128403 RepID=A0A139XEP7_9CYAN|nr:hypothetical protein [Scytonema hofmannii]KYC43175.1 hypothetical protein WA1_13840 [Scytonema hofmannii PCC 7110]
MSIITIQTLATNSDNNKIALDYLEEYGGIFGQATRTAFSKRNRINLKRHGSIKINVQDKRSAETKDTIGKAVSEVVKIALIPFLEN